MIYIPCLSNILALASEFGWRKAMGLTIAEIGTAIMIGGIAFRLLSLFM